MTTLTPLQRLAEITRILKRVNRRTRKYLDTTYHFDVVERLAMITDKECKRIQVLADTEKTTK